MAAGPVIGSNPSAAWVSRSSSSSVSSRSAAAALRFELLDAACAGDGDDVRLADQPRQAPPAPGWRRGTAAISRSASSRTRPRSRFSGRNNALFERTPPGIVRAVPAGRQEPLRQRAVGDDDPIVGLRPRQQLGLGPAGHQAVLHLVGQHRAAQRAVGVLPASQPEVAHPDVPDDAAVVEAAHPRHRRLQRHHRVRPVQLVQVDHVNAQPAGAGPGAAARRSGRAAGPGTPSWR